MSSQDLARFAAISCLHVPYHRQAMIDRLCTFLAYRELTHFIVLGDLFEAAAASVHSDEHAHKLEDEYRAAALVLDQIRNALPENCTLVWLLGNHDDNLRRPDKRRIDARLRSLLDWNQSPWADSFKAWKQVGYAAPSKHDLDNVGLYQLGQVCFIHGTSTNDNAQAKRVRFALGGIPHLLVVAGHTHRPAPVTQCKDGSTKHVHCYFANAGTMRILNPRPTFTTPVDISEWDAAVVVGEAKLGRTSRMTKPQWQARTYWLDNANDCGAMWTMD